MPVLISTKFVPRNIINCHDFLTDPVANHSDLKFVLKAVALNGVSEQLNYGFFFFSQLNGQSVDDMRSSISVFWLGREVVINHSRLGLLEVAFVCIFDKYFSLRDDNSNGGELILSLLKKSIMPINFKFALLILVKFWSVNSLSCWFIHFQQVCICGFKSLRLRNWNFLMATKVLELILLLHCILSIGGLVIRRTWFLGFGCSKLLRFLSKCSGHFCNKVLCIGFLSSIIDQHWIRGMRSVVKCFTFHHMMIGPMFHTWVIPYVLLEGFCDLVLINFWVHVLIGFR